MSRRKHARVTVKRMLRKDSRFDLDIIIASSGLIVQDWCKCFFEWERACSLLGGCELSSVGHGRESFHRVEHGATVRSVATGAPRAIRSCSAIAQISTAIVVYVPLLRLAASSSSAITMVSCHRLPVPGSGWLWRGLLRVSDRLVLGESCQAAQNHRSAAPVTALAIQLEALIKHCSSL